MKKIFLLAFLTLALAASGSTAVKNNFCCVGPEPKCYPTDPNCTPTLQVHEPAVRSLNL